MELIDGKPVIYLHIEEDLQDGSGLDAIAFVDNPATEVNWLAFSKDKKKSQPEIVNDEQRMVTAPVMLADTPIYRYHESVGEFYTKFSAETIKKMMVKYFKQNKIHNVNEMHQGHLIVDGVYLVESYIVGERVQSSVYPDIPDGSWVATFYIEDEKYWNDKIKTGEFSGISLEGDFIHSTNEYKYSAIKKLLEEDLSEEELFNAIEKII